MKTVFISDLHLSAHTKKSNAKFIQLLTKWQDEIDALYILGDFFDAWLGDDDQNEFIDEIKHGLKRFSAKKPVFFIVGNHDFALGKRFARETGMTLLKDCTTVKIDNHDILLSHGDIFCTLDIAYQKMRKILQNKFTLFLLRYSPLSWRRKLKQTLESKSASSFNAKPAHTYLVVDETIAAIATKAQVNMVIHGHTHVPGSYVIHANSQAISRIEIPDWADREPGGFVLLENGEITIHLP